MLNPAPRVSVIMGVYNGEAFLDDAVRSVVAQTCPDWELVLVDDGSTDGTGALADRWAAADARVRVIHQPNSGKPASARNRGIRDARGEVIAFLDGDDLYHPDKLATQMAVFDARPEVGAVFHDYRWFKSGLSPEQGLRYLERQHYLTRASAFFSLHVVGSIDVFVGTRDLIKFMSTEQIGIHTSAIAVRRAVLASLDQPPFDESLPHGEDNHLWLRIARQTILACVNRPLSYYRHHPDSWVNSKTRGIQAMGSFLVKSDMLRRVEPTLSPAERPLYRERIAEYWYGIGYRCLVGGLVPEARESFRASLRRTRAPRLVFRCLKGLLVSRLPRALTRAWWRATDGGEFEVKKDPEARRFAESSPR